jgi:hypothetical protein
VQEMKPLKAKRKNLVGRVLETIYIRSSLLEVTV